jgi:hypothetical protein
MLLPRIRCIVAATTRRKTVAFDLLRGMKTHLIPSLVLQEDRHMRMVHVDGVLTILEADEAATVRSPVHQAMDPLVHEGAVLSALPVTILLDVAVKVHLELLAMDHLADEAARLVVGVGNGVETSGQKWARNLAKSASSLASA